MKRKNKNVALEIRLPSEDKALLKMQAERANMTMSNYVRLLIENAIFQLRSDLRSGKITYDDLLKFLEEKEEIRKFFKK